MTPADRQSLLLRAYSLYLEVAGAGLTEDALRVRCEGNDALLRAVLAHFAAARDAAAGDAWLEDRLHTGTTAAFVGGGHLVGYRAGGYVLEGVLGCGGSGVVYRARGVDPPRPVAVKVLLDPFAGEEAAERFRLEHNALAVLEGHPGIARIHDAGTFDDGVRRLPFFAMELIEGGRPITDHARCAGLDLEARLELFARVLDAVAYAHRKGIIHRDLKPANILVDGSGIPRIIDFGIARIANGAPDRRWTRTGQLLGTLDYMSPEQCRGDARATDARSDIYALGVILYELVAGERPYDVDLPLLEAAAVIQTQAPADLPRVAGRLQPALEAILWTALAKDPDRRYATVDQLAIDLRAALEGRALSVRRPGHMARLLSWASRRPKLATTVVAAVIAIAIVAGAAIGVSLVALRPAAVEIEPGGRRVVLRSAAGFPLHVWDSGVRDGVLSAIDLDGPASTLLSGGRVALGFASASRLGAGEVCLFSTLSPAEERWCTNTATMTLPQGEVGHREARFIPEGLATGDVFPEVPGMELVVAHKLDGFAATAIRVYDLEGRVLYHVWHDGAVGDPQLLPAAHGASPLLAVAGKSSEYLWDQRGIGVFGIDARYPNVIVALRPRVDHVREDRWLARDGAITDETVAWYRWLGPAEEVWRLGELAPSLQAARDPRTGATWLRLVLGDERPGPTRPVTRASALLMFTIDGDGREVARHETDVFRMARRRGELLDPAPLRWVDYRELPPPRRQP